MSRQAVTRYSILDPIIGSYHWFRDIITPLIIWFTLRNAVEYMDSLGKAILNLQLGFLLYIVLSIPAILLLDKGMLTLIVIGIWVLFYQL